MPITEDALDVQDASDGAITWAVTDEPLLHAVGIQPALVSRGAQVNAVSDGGIPRNASRPGIFTTIVYDTDNFVPAYQTFPIIAVNQPAGQFTIAGNHVALFTNFVTLFGVTSGPNQAIYQTQATALVGGNTVITALGGIPSGAGGASLVVPATTRFVIPRAGVYLLNASINLAGGLQNDIFSALFLNATSTLNAGVYAGLVPNPATINAQVPISAIIRAVAGNGWGLSVGYNSAANPLPTYRAVFSIAKIG